MIGAPIRTDASIRSICPSRLRISPSPHALRDLSECSTRSRTQPRETQTPLQREWQCYSRLRSPWRIRIAHKERQQESGGVQFNDAASDPGGALPISRRWRRVLRTSTGSVIKAMTFVSEPPMVQLGTPWRRPTDQGCPDAPRQRGEWTVDPGARCE